MFCFVHAIIDLVLQLPYPTLLATLSFGYLRVVTCLRKVEILVKLRYFVLYFSMVLKASDWFFSVRVSPNFAFFFFASGGKFKTWLTTRLIQICSNFY